MRILLSRTDNIGDVILTLPMAGVLKKYLPECEVYFLGKNYTRDVVECCQHVDKFFSWDEIKISKSPLEEIKKLNCDVIVHVFPNKEICFLAKEANIPCRIGTNRRLFHWIGCNKKVNLSRKKSSLHESQLNLKLLSPLNIPYDISLKEIPHFYGFKPKEPENTVMNSFIDKTKFNLILHPKSKGSAREWSAQHYIELIQLLTKINVNVLISGTKEEEKEINEKILSHCPNAKSVVGKFTLKEFISFINMCDGFIACSTGPLHIAAALEKQTLGFYPPISVMHPKRWGPLGKNAQSIIGHPNQNLNNQIPFCSLKICKKSSPCLCLQNISAINIYSLILNWFH